MFLQVMNNFGFAKILTLCGVFLISVLVSGGSYGSLLQLCKEDSEGIQLTGKDKWRFMGVGVLILFGVGIVWLNNGYFSWLSVVATSFMIGCLLPSAWTDARTQLVYNIYVLAVLLSQGVFCVVVYNAKGCGLPDALGLVFIGGVLYLLSFFVYSKADALLLVACMMNLFICFSGYILRVWLLVLIASAYAVLRFGYVYLKNRKLQQRFPFTTAILVGYTAVLFI